MFLHASLQAFILPGIQNTIVFPIIPAVALDNIAAESISSKLSVVKIDPNAVSSL